MFRTCLTLAIGICLIAALVACPAAAPADDVTIKVIDPEKTPPPKTAAPVPPDSPRARPGTVTEGPPIAASGNRRLDGTLRRLNLSEDQAARLAPVLEANRKEREQVDQDFRTKMDGLREQLRQAAGDAEKTKPLSDQMQQMFADRRKADEQAQQQLTEKVLPVLTAEQTKQFKDAMDNSPAAVGRRFSGQAVRFMVGDVELTEQQQEQAAKVVQERIAEFSTRQEQLREQMRPLWERLRANRDDAEARKALNELTSQIGTLMQEQMAATRKAVDEVLTPEQRAKADEARQQRTQQASQRMIDWRTRSFDAAGLTDAQKSKVEELTAAARDAMNKLPAEDWRGRGELSEQLRKDIEALLTDEQKQKVQAATPRFGRGGFGGGQEGGVGGRGGRGGARGGPGGPGGPGAGTPGGATD